MTSAKNAKRACDTKAKSSAAKRTKVVQSPVEKNFEIVERALANEECIIPGPESCRAMLMAVASAALKIPKEERHENQNAVIEIMREIFATEKGRWATKVAEANSVVDAATTKRTEKVTEKDAADAELRAQKNEVCSKMESQASAMEVVQECEEVVQSAHTKHADAHALQQKLIKEQEHVHAVLETVKALKDGSCEDPKELKRNLAAVTSLFKGMAADEGFTKVLPQVLGRKPSERGSFDELALQQLDSYVENHLSSLGSKIEAAGVDVKDHAVEVTAWEAAVELAQEKKCDSDEALKGAEEKQAQLEEALASARKVLKEHTAVLKNRNSDLAAEQVGLQKSEDVCTSLDFLQEYTTPPPQEEVTEMEEVASEEAPQTSEELTPMPEATVNDEVVQPVGISAKMKEMPEGMPDIPSPSKRRSLTPETAMVV